MTRPGNVLAGRFEIERLAGRGAAGEVYRAHDRQADAPVAVKLVRAQDRGHIDRFLREAVILAELRHPGVVRYVAHGSTDEGAFLAMEWLEGETLGARLRRGKLRVAETVPIGIEVAGALSAAHERGIVHRDLKPSNLFLVAGGSQRAPRIKVLDFGVARLLAQPLTRTGAVIGTPGYMAPEQVRGAREVDARADVFALGCVLFECLTGRRAFEGEQPMSVLLRILLEDAPHLRDVDPLLPADLDVLVARMLAKSAVERPRDAHAVAEELAGLGAGPDSMPASLRGRALGGSEQRPLSLVLARGPASAEEAPGSGGDEERAPALDDTTGSSERDRDTLRDTASAVESLQGAVEELGERLDMLPDGTLLITIAREGAATDRAGRAARCAVLLLRHRPELEVAVVSGRAEVSREASVGEIIRRAVDLLGVRRRRVGVLLDDVSAALLEGDFDVDRAGPVAVLRGERRRIDAARTLLGRPMPCVGRERQLAGLHAYLAECVSEPMARVVLVTGAPGVGKSRLRYEFQRGLPDAELWFARGDPMRAGAAFGLLGQAVLGAAGVGPSDPPTSRRRKLSARAARHVDPAESDRIASFLGELCGIAFSDRQRVQLRAARRDPVLMGDQIRRAWEDFVAAECAARPVVLILEDLHWGDLPTVQLVDAALRRAIDRPLLVLAVARPEVHQLFPDLWSDRDLHEVRLGPLTPKGAARLVREALGERLHDAEVIELVERSGGNAFYLEELIRAVSEGRGEALPETVIAMAEARLTRLDPEARRVLRAASIFGATFPRSGVAALLGDSDGGRLDAWLALLATQEVIGRRRGSTEGGTGPDVSEEYDFRHALMREAAYAALTEEDRRLGHRLAGEWLERTGQGGARELGEHFDLGGKAERAVEWWRRAAEAALEGNDLQATVTYAARAVASGADGEALAAVQVAAAEALRWQGKVTEALIAGTQAMAAGGPGTPPWYAASEEVAFACGASGQLARLDALAAELVEVGGVGERANLSESAELPTVVLARDGAEGARGSPHRLPEDNAARLMALAQLVVQLLASGRTERAAEVVTALEVEAPGAGDDPAVRAAVVRAQAARALYGGDPGLYLALSLQRLPLLEQAGDLRAGCLARGTIGYAYMILGAWEEAERVLREALHAGERLGLAFAIRHAQHNLGLVLAMRGNLEDGWRVEEQAAEAYRAAGDARLEGACRVYLSVVHALGGHVGEAEQAAQEAVALTAAAPPYRVPALAVLAEARLLRGDVAGSRAAAEEAMRLLDEIGAIEEGEARCRLAYVRALLASGATGEARAALRLACERLYEHAGKIGDEAWRRSFLTRVPENAATLGLAEQWLR